MNIVKQGQMLRNGSIVIDVEIGIVLAVNPDKTEPYSVWTIDEMQNCTNGDYFRSLSNAHAVYQNRLIKR